MLSDFSYKHDAKQCSTLVVTKIHAEDSDDAVLKMLTDVISTAKSCMSFSYHVHAPANKHYHDSSWDSTDSCPSPDSFPSCPGRGSPHKVHSQLLQAFTRDCQQRISLEFLIPHLCLEVFLFAIHIIPREHCPSVVW